MRLSAGDSRRFAALFRDAMAECGFSSVYRLYLHADVPRATLHRWLNGRVRIPITGAQELIDVLDQFSNHNAPLSALRDWLDAARAAASAEERLHAELRARRVPVARTIDALRAAKLLPAENAAHHGTIEAD